MSERESEQAARIEGTGHHEDKQGVLVEKDEEYQQPEAMDDHDNKANQEPKETEDHNNQENKEPKDRDNQENQEPKERNGNDNQENKEPKHHDNQENKAPEQKEEQNNEAYQAIAVEFMSITDKLPHVNDLNVMLAYVKRLCALIPAYLCGVEGSDGVDADAMGLKKSLFICLREFLRRHDCEELQQLTIYALLLLFNEKTAPMLWKYIIVSNIIPLFVDLLNLKKLWLPCMSALPHLIGSNPACRQQALDAGVLGALEFVRAEIPSGCVTVAKCLSYLCQDLVGHPLALYMLKILIRHKNERIISATCVAIHGYIGDGDVSALRSLVCHGIARILFQFIAHPSYDIASTSLMIVEKMSATPGLLTVSLVQGLLPKLLGALSRDAPMRHAICRTLRYVTRSPENAAAVIATRVVPAVLRVLNDDQEEELDAEITEEAWRVICNTLIHSSAIEMCQLIGEGGCAGYVGAVLVMGNVLLTGLALDAIKSILQKSRTISRAMQCSVAKTLHASSEIFLYLRELLEHENEEIKRKAKSVLKIMSRLVNEHKES
jgi:hypothetical protein